MGIQEGAIFRRIRGSIIAEALDGPTPAARGYSDNVVDERQNEILADVAHGGAT